MSDIDDLESIFAAVGKAMSRWETLEAHLSYTYSIFEGKPIDHALLENYGRDGRIFKDRMDILRKSGERYFQKRPNQKEECRFEGLVSEAFRLANFRHRIAHGMVMGAQDHADKILFWLVPPSHGFFHLTKHEGDYAYSSKDIEAISDEFVGLAASVNLFNRERHSPN